MAPTCSIAIGPAGPARTRGRFAASLRRLAVTGVLAAVPGSALAAPPSYDVAVLPAIPGRPYIYPRGMNESGDIVADAGERLGERDRAVLYSPAGVTLLPWKGITSVEDLNETALIVGAADGGPYYWQGGVSDYLPGGNFTDGAVAVNAAGQIVGNTSHEDGSVYPVYWPSTQSPMQSLQALSPFGSGSANAINGAGQIAGQAAGSAVRWANAGAAPTVIGRLPGASWGEALAINSAGDLAGASYYSNFANAEAMFYDETAGQLVGLGTLGGDYSVARGINDTQAVVGESNGPAGMRGFLWLDGTMYDLNDLVASSDVPISAVIKAVAINNAGQIAAEVVLPSGERRAARLTPLGAAAIPAVSATGLAVTALLLAALGFQLLRRRLPANG